MCGNLVAIEGDWNLPIIPSEIITEVDCGFCDECCAALMQEANESESESGGRL